MNTIETIHLELNNLQAMQKFEGWGTSLCWWANIVGRWETPGVIEKLSRLLFDETDGLGLTVVRYNLGAGESPPNISNFRKGADMPCFFDSSGNWHWERDAAQQKILDCAIACGVNHVELFMNSPPQWMTSSGSTAGSESGLCNLAEGKVNELAEYLAECVSFFSCKYGKKITSIAPFNEPMSFWWTNDNNQEGCHFDVQQQAELIAELGDALRYRGVGDVRISAPEGWSTFETIYCCNHYPQQVLRYIGQINTHSYYSDMQSRKELANIAHRLGKPLWMSEVTCGGTQIHCHEDMTSALELAQNITVHLNEMQAQGWVYWQAIENERIGHNHGLLHADFETDGVYYSTKQYSAFANFTRLIRPGYTILKGAPEGITVGCSPDGKQLAIVAVNLKHNPIRILLSCTGVPMREPRKVFRTSCEENMVSIPCFEGQILVLPPQSITSLIYE